MNLRLNVQELRVDVADAYHVEIDCDVDTQNVIDEVISEDENLVIGSIDVKNFIGYHGTDELLDNIDRTDILEYLGVEE